MICTVSLKRSCYITKDYSCIKKKEKQATYQNVGFQAKKMNATICWRRCQKFFDECVWGKRLQEFHQWTWNMKDCSHMLLVPGLTPDIFLKLCIIISYNLPAPVTFPSMGLSLSNISSYLYLSLATTQSISPTPALIPSPP